MQGATEYLEYPKARNVFFVSDSDSLMRMYYEDRISGVDYKRRLNMFGWHCHKTIQYRTVEPSRSTIVIRVTRPIWDCSRPITLEDEITGSCSTHIVIDLSGVRRATTAAFAQLIKLKSLLRRNGRDMHVQGLRGQPMALCEILKLTDLLLERKPLPNRALQHLAIESSQDRLVETQESRNSTNRTINRLDSLFSRHPATLLKKEPEPCLC